jgi:hypothetical protein
MMRAVSLRGVQTRTTPQNLFPLLFAAEAALAKLASVNNMNQPCARVAKKKMDELLCTNAEEVFEQEEWLTILERDGAGFSDAEQVHWVMEAVMRGLGDATAGTVYQARALHSSTVFISGCSRECSPDTHFGSASVNTNESGGWTSRTAIIVNIPNTSRGRKHSTGHHPVAPEALVGGSFGQRI